MFLVIALRLTVKGEANVHWERTTTERKDSRGHNQTQTHTDHFRGNELYFNLTYSLLGNTGGKHLQIFKSISEKERYLYNINIARIIKPINIARIIKHSRNQ